MRLAEELKFSDARERQWLWKTNAMLDMAKMFVRLALGQDEFTANDLPDDFAQGGPGIAGSVTKILANAGIIKKRGAWIGDQFMCKMATSARHDNHGSSLFTWTLASRGLAERFLTRNHATLEPQQKELVLA